MKLIFSMVFLMLLTSCASTDYFEAATQCDNNHRIPLINADGTVETKAGKAVTVIEKGFCEVEWDRYNRAEKRKDDIAEFKRRTACSKGQIFICRDTWCRQGRTRRLSNRKIHKTDTIRSYCVKADNSVFRF